MPPRRQPAPKTESKTGLVVALVFFVLMTIILGVTTYMGFDGQKELESKSSAAAAETKKANDSATEARARLLADQIMTGMAAAPQGDAGALNSNPAFKDELGQFAKSFGTWGVGWDPSTGAPPESVLVVLGKLKAAKDTAENNATAAFQQRDKAKTDYEAQAATHEAARKQAEIKQADFAKAATEAQAKEQEAKTFGRDEIAKLGAKIKEDAQTAANKIGELLTDVKRKTEEIEGKTKTVEKLSANTDAQRAKIILTDIRHGVVTKVDIATDTAFINLGSADYVRPGMSFSVLQQYDASRFGPEEGLPKKASLAVIRILGTHTAETKIKYADDVNQNKDPVRSGDGLYKPGWKPGNPVHWALAGHFDLNGLGRDETKLLMQRLEKQGIVVDAYLDLSTLRVVGELNYGIDYLIVGTRPSGEVARVIGEDRKKAIEDAINDMVGKAQTMGIAVMQGRVFLPISGIELPRTPGFPYFPGGGAGGAPTGDQPKADKPKDKDKDKDEGK